MTSADIPGPRTNEAYRIVVTTDGSSDSERAVHAVSGLARVGRLQVSLLRVYEPTVADRGDAAEVLASAEDLRVLRRRFPDTWGVETVVRTIGTLGDVHTAILDTAREVNASAIAISTHGHSARHDVFAGSVAIRILRQSHLPVLLARSGHPLS